MKREGSFPLTFVYGLAARSIWPHTVSMTTKCHQASNDGRFAKSHVADDNRAPAGCWIITAEAGVHFLEEPLPAGEEPIR